jgi:hypothetical protein
MSTSGKRSNAGFSPMKLIVPLRPIDLTLKPHTALEIDQTSDPRAYERPFTKMERQQQSMWDLVSPFHSDIST